MLEDILEKFGVSLEEVLDSIKVGIYVTDGEGNTITLNEECCKTGGLSKEEVVGKNMRELMEMGYVIESDSFKVIESGEEERFIQNLGDGGQIYITGVPIYKNGKIALIVSTERNISETIELKSLLEESKQKSEQYKTGIHYLCQNTLLNGDMVFQSFLMRQVLDQAARFGKIDTTVLIQGESGTGKEMIADYIYKSGNRSQGVFIKVNCAAIPESLIESELFGYEKGAFTGAEKDGKLGLFEATDGGTIFLDEIGDLPLQMQAKLLRVLQEKEIRRIGGNASKKVDVKIIAATNIDLKQAVQENRFREDLYYRLNVATLEIPPLRSRKEDIKPLALYFIEKLNGKYGMDKRIQSDGLEVLEEYEWPGNVRELRNTIERIMINYDSNTITKFQLFRQIKGGTPDLEYGSSGLSLKEIINRYEKEVLMQYIEKYKSGLMIAKALKVDAATISRKLKKHNLSL